MKSTGSFFVLALAVIALVACRPGDVLSPSEGERPRIVATTSIVGDIVQRVGGDDIRLQVLVPPRADPHDYIFRPADMVVAADADLLFINGGGLEGHLDRLLKGVARPEQIVSLVQGIPMRHFEGAHHHAHGDDCEDSAALDPHVWTDPNHVMIWAETIARALSQLAPEYAEAFSARANELIEDLRELDTWIAEQVAVIPPERRLLVTDHYAMGYFAARYGFEEAGVVIRSLDSAAQPSARDLVRLIDELKARQIPAIFVGMSVNPQLARQIARDSGVSLVPLYSGALSESDGPAADYFAYMRYNVSALVEYLQ